MRKEWLEWTVGDGNVIPAWLKLLLFSIIFGIILTLVAGAAWPARLLAVLIWAWLPLFLLVGDVADTFAGERERHTLEMLLASRLSEEVIVLGKVLAVTAYGWLYMLLSAFFALLVAAFVYGFESLALLSLGQSIVVIGFALAVSWFFGTVGVIVSMRASSRHHARQVLGSGMLVILILLLVTPSLFAAFGWHAPYDRLTGIAVGSDIYTFLALAALGLLAINGGLLVLLCCRFRRTRVMLKR